MGARSMANRAHQAVRLCQATRTHRAARSARASRPPARVLRGALYLVLLVLLLCLCLSLSGCGTTSTKSAGASKKADSSKSASASKKGAETPLKDQPDISGIRKLPASYRTPARHRGKVTSISYAVTTPAGARITKKALVYIPYGYSDTRRYDVFYLLHGYGGSEATFLGAPSKPRTFRNILDHMIDRGDMAPAIVVTPTLAYHAYSDYYTMLEATDREITEVLVPLVEGRWSTYARSTDRAGLQASRAHRAIGGFSVGGCMTWRMLKDNADLFQWYLPCSMPLYYYEKGYDPAQNETGTKDILAGVQAARARLNAAMPLYIFAASGGKDFMCEATRQQALALSQQSSLFTWSSDCAFSSGNITFHAWSGRPHRYTQSFDYLYNGLIRFYKKVPAGK